MPGYEHPAVPVVGLTGGIASGKSTVARLFVELGAGLVDADALAREVVAPGSEGLQEVVALLGTEVLAPDGSLDRKAVGARVFGDPEARKQLERITHPKIAQLSAARIAALQQTSVPYVLYEAALLVETGIHRSLAAVIVVAASAALQLERIRMRDGLSEEEARARLAAQLPLEHKLAVAEYVIRNEGTLTETRAQTRRVHAALLERFARH